jgi:CRP-like cAMP-binding protein
VTVKTLDTIVREHPLFAPLSRAQARIVAGCASNVVFDADTEIFHTGEKADTFYLLRHGRVALDVYAGERGALTIDTLGPRDLLGWSWLIPPYRWQFDARAVDLVRAVAFDGACLRRKIEDDHDLGYHLYVRFSRVLLERLQTTRLRLVDVYGNGTH